MAFTWGHWTADKALSVDNMNSCLLGWGPKADFPAAATYKGMIAMATDEGDRLYYSSGAAWVTLGLANFVKQGRVGYYRPPATGKGLSAGGYAWATNYMFAVPFPVGRTITFDRIAVQNNGAGDGVMRLGIYSDTNGAPGALVLDAGELTVTASAGVKALVITQALVPGLYWLAGAQSSGGFANANLSAIEAEEWVLPQGGVTDTALYLGPCFGWVLRAFTYAALPDPWGTPVWQSAAMPIVGMRSS